VVLRKLRGCEVVIRVIEYHVVCSLCARAHEQSDFGSKRRVVETERREIVRIETNVVLLGDAAGARTKRAPVLWHLRAVLPVRRHYHPFPKQGVPAEFIHNVHFFILGVTFQTLATEVSHLIG
jgi:hypothetical protein